MLCNLPVDAENIRNSLFDQRSRLGGSNLLVTDRIGDDHIVKVCIKKYSQQDHRYGGDYQVGDGQFGLDTQAFV